MISRTVKSLTNKIVFGLSKKKLTQQWKKPVEQLKQQAQQNSPLPKDTDQRKKAAREWVQSVTKQHQKSEKTMFKSKQRSQRKQNKTQTQGLEAKITQQKSANPQSQNKSRRLSQRNWLQAQQQNKYSKQLIDSVNQGVKFFKLKYSAELKDTMLKIYDKFQNNGLQLLMGTLCNIDFHRAFQQFKSASFDLTKVNSKIINSILFNLASQQQTSKLQQFLKTLKSAKVLLDHKQQELFQILFLKQTSNQVKFLTGQNSVNFSSQNKIFVQKLSVAYQYLRLLQENGKRRKGGKKSVVIPLWLDKATKLVIKYRCGMNQFRNLFTQITNNHDYLIPETFYQTEQFALILKQIYFGHQQQLQVILDMVEKHLNKIKFQIFYRNFTNQLMNYRTEFKQPAFQADQVLVENYKKAFQTKQKYSAILCSIIGSDARYDQLAEHYTRNYVQGFTNQKLDSQDTKFVEQCLLNNYNQSSNDQKLQKLLTKIAKNGHNTLIKVKASIKLGNLIGAYKIFQQEVYKQVVIKKLRKVIEYVLRKNITDNKGNFTQSKESKQFLDSLKDQYLWTLYQKTQDLSVILKHYLPKDQDKFTFWEETQNRQRFQQISLKKARGQLKNLKQPESDINASGFNLDEYLRNQFPHLQELQTKKYQVQKQLIKYTLKVEGAIMMQKVRDDRIVADVIKQAQQGLSQQNLQILQNFGLKDYDILQYEFYEFNKRFQNMKLYKYVVRDEKLNWQRFEKYLQKNKSITNKNTLEQIIIKAPELFRQAESLVKLPEQNIVSRLLLWGVYANQPMAIYLGQKLAMQTGQIIPHEIAVKVSQMLSYKRPLSEQFIQKCKQALKIVGKINRQYIYAFDKQYEHILLRKNFVNFVQSQIASKKKDNRQLQDLINYNPRPQLHQQQSRLYIESIQNRAQYLA